MSDSKDIVKSLIVLLSEKNVEIRKMSSQVLDVVMVPVYIIHALICHQEYDKDWAYKIREKKFQAHNAEWVKITHVEDKNVNDKRAEKYRQYDDLDGIYEKEEASIASTHSGSSMSRWKNLKVYGAE